MLSPRRTAGPTTIGRRALVASLTGLAGVLCLGAPADAATAATPRAKLQRALDRVVAAGAPGAVALVRDGDRTIRVSSGLGRLAPKTPSRVAHPTRIGGMTKSYVATVVLQLVDEGRIGLGDALSTWLPGAIVNGDAITVRQLLNHTSGIYSYDQDDSVFAPYLQGDLTKPFDPVTGVTIAREHGPLSAPGTQLSYSNTNYVLLAMIVEAATGNDIATELSRRIVAPLGLRRTTYPSSSRIRGAHIHGYFAPGGSLLDITPLAPSLLGAAGALVSDAADVATFYRALLSGRLLSAAGLVAMQSIDPVATGGIADAGILGGGWGLGLLRERFACGTAWGHDSETPGFMTAAWSSTGGARQVVVFVNTNAGHDAPVSRAMRGVLKRGFCGR